MKTDKPIPRPNARGPRERLRPREQECLDALRAGTRAADVAVAMKVHRSQVSRWKRKFLDLGLIAAEG